MNINMEHKVTVMLKVCGLTDGSDIVKYTVWY